ncbi:phage holin, partial [Escherichia coli]|uniref:phage holin n=1 Tax=Escherichia coli TaxID=562 RepID=UPI003F6DE294
MKCVLFDWKNKIKPSFEDLEEIKLIDWKSRIKYNQFWLSLIPAVLLLIQVVAVPFGYK